MPSPTALAAAAAAASTTPGAAAPILSAWLVVRRRRSAFSFAKRRYVTLTSDHVLLVDSTPVLHLVDCHLSANPSQKTLDLTPLPQSGLPVRILADSPFQYAKWRAALHRATQTSLSRFYTLHMRQLLGVGVHGIVRRATPLPSAALSVDSEYEEEEEDYVYSIVKQRPSMTDSLDLDPDGIPGGGINGIGVPASKSAKQVLKEVEGIIEEEDGALDHLAAPNAVAVKTVARVANGAVTVASEMLVAKARLRHHGIVHVLDVFETVHEVHIVMEECLGGTLKDRIDKYGPFGEPEARRVFLPVLKGVGYMHACGIAHWDIRPDNIMFKDEEGMIPKIIDFGTCRPVDPGNGRVPAEGVIFQEKGKVASLACASPELLTSKAHRYAAKADMWQMGCLLYYMIVGKLPFAKRSVQDLSMTSTILAFCKKRSKQREAYLFDQRAIGDAQISQSARELLLMLLCPNPRMRPNVVQCLREFAFFAQIPSQR